MSRVRLFPADTIDDLRRQVDAFTAMEVLLVVVWLLAIVVCRCCDRVLELSTSWLSKSLEQSDQVVEDGAEYVNAVTGEETDQRPVLGLRLNSQLLLNGKREMLLQ